MKTSPGALTFCRDIFVDVSIMADLIAIRNNRQQLIDGPYPILELGTNGTV